MEKTKEESTDLKTVKPLDVQHFQELANYDKCYDAPGWPKINLGQKLPTRNELANRIMADDVKEAVRKLKLRKAPGGDGTVTKLIKKWQAHAV